MISVCIPVFNTEVGQLVRSLAAEAARLPFPVEVLVYDDGSSDEIRKINRTFIGMFESPGVSSPGSRKVSKAEDEAAGSGNDSSDTGRMTDPAEDGTAEKDRATQETTSGHGGKSCGNFRVIYRELPQNIGRAAIRNEMGKAAKFPWLLFLDADSGIPSGNFLKLYAEAASSGSVICGGTAYLPEPPDNPKCRLRWVYGREREQLSAAQRRSSGKFAITANNFLINRDLFLRILFRTVIREYGHEDTVLGYDLVRAGYTISHIDNPVIHLGLEPSFEYLEKTRAAVANLLYISENLIHDPQFDQESGLLSARKRIRHLGLLPLARLLFRLTESFLVRNLTGISPKIRYFDLFRLLYLCSLEIN